jgi:hypothetical protein
MAGVAGQVTVALLVLLFQKDPGVYDAWSKGPPKDPSFFPIAVWLQGTHNAAAYKAAGINTYVALYGRPTAEQFDQLKAAGMKLVCHQSPFALGRKDDDTIIAWMHGDEPDNAQSKKGGGYGPPIAPEKIVEDYKKLKESDPTRPILLNLGQGVAWDSWVGRGVRTQHPEDYPEYLKGCDIASFDIYPAVHDKAEVAGKLWFVPEGVERLRRWTNDEKPVWNCIEASRIDNPAVKPSVAQIRSEVWMSLIHGSRGLIYFVHQFKPSFIEASLLRDEELLKGVTAINRQIQDLAPVLNSPTVKDGAEVTLSAPEAPVASMVKRQGGATYLFAVAMRDQPVRATFTLKEPRAGTVEVLGEHRTVTLKDGRLGDEFKGFEPHLYRIIP